MKYAGLCWALKAFAKKFDICLSVPFWLPRRQIRWTQLEETSFVPKDRGCIVEPKDTGTIGDATPALHCLSPEFFYRKEK